MALGLIKPADTAPTLRAGNSTMLVYGVDTSSGMVDVSSNGYTPNTARLPSRTSTSYGTGYEWNAVDDFGGNGDGNWFSATTAIRDATNLRGQSIGAGFTFGTVYLQDASNTGLDSLIFGRPGRAQENAPFHYWTFEAAQNGTEVTCRINDGSTAWDNGSFATVGSIDPGSLSVIGRLICSVENISITSGVATATARFYAAFGDAGSPTFVGAHDCVVGDFSGPGTDEQQSVMFMRVIHIPNTQVSALRCGGHNFQGFFDARPWTDAEKIAWCTNPYNPLHWDGIPDENNVGMLLLGHS